MALEENLAFGLLRLRKPVSTDAAAVNKNWATDPEVAIYSSWKRHASIGATADYVQVLQQQWINNDNERTWMVTTSSSDDAIGGFTVRRHGHGAEIGYAIGKPYWSLGYMSEIASGMASLLLSEPDVFRVWAYCDTENLGSARVLEKSGFTREGILRRWAVFPNLSEEPRDCYCYSRVR